MNELHKKQFFIWAKERKKAVKKQPAEKNSFTTSKFKSKAANDLYSFMITSQNK